MTLYRLLLFPFVVVTFASCSGRAPDSASDKKPLSETGAESAQGEAKPAPDKIALSDEVQQRLRLAVTPAEQAPFAMTLQASGSVKPIDSRVAHVRPLARGRIQEVVVKLGDRVEPGQPLAVFDNMEAGELASQYDAATAELARLRVALATATRQSERSRRLAEIGAVPQKEAEAALAEQQQFDASVHGQEATLAGMEARLRRYGVSSSISTRTSTSSILSPFAGVVTRVAAAPGDVVDPSTDLFAVADVSRVVVQAQVHERDLGRVRVGEPATITVDAYPDERFSARVVSIGDALDPETRTVLVRCELENSKHQLKLDMLATVGLSTTSTGLALAVPTAAIQTYEDHLVVFVKSGASQFEARPVTTGRVSGTRTEVLTGLHPGDAVVTTGAFQVKSALLAKSLAEKE